MSIKLGKTDTGTSVGIKTAYLNHHMAVFGATGSGKTGQVIGIVEQAMYKKVPIVLVDIKGDLINTLQQDDAILEELDVTLLTPGATHGTSVNLFLGLNDPAIGLATLGQLCEIIGVPRNSTRSKGYAFLASVVQELHKRKKPCNIKALMENCMEPQIEKVGLLPVDHAITEGLRKDLLLRLNGLFCDPEMADWMQGIDLDMSSLLTPKNGKTPVIVYSVVHLVDETEKMFALTLFFEKMVSWMREKGGKGEMRGLLVVDECSGLFPPHPQNPSTKKPLMTIFKQGREYGLGMLVATQNPKDVCYKALGNCHTWLIGRLQTDNDRSRVLEGVLNKGSCDKKAVGQLMNGLGKRKFLRIHEGNVVRYSSRDVNAELTGPASIEEFKTLQEWFTPTRKLMSMMNAAIRIFNKDKTEASLKDVVRAQYRYVESGGKL